MIELIQVHIRNLPLGEIVRIIGQVVILQNGGRRAGIVDLDPVRVVTVFVSQGADIVCREFRNHGLARNDDGDLKIARGGAIGIGRGEGETFGAAGGVGKGGRSRNIGSIQDERGRI